MAQKSRATLKTYYETGDKPLASQFGDWLDSYFHKTDLDIPQAAVVGLVAALAAKFDKADGDAIVDNRRYYNEAVTAVVTPISFKDRFGVVSALPTAPLYIHVWGITAAGAPVYPNAVKLITQDGFSVKMPVACTLYYDAKS